jgi:hypothetical protein
MAKITLTPYDKDDPIFTEGLTFFKPISRPAATEKEAKKSLPNEDRQVDVKPVRKKS